MPIFQSRVNVYFLGKIGCLFATIYAADRKLPAPETVLKRRATAE
jgi:hypothetical protein